MKKLLSLLLSAAITATLFTACSDNGHPQEQSGDNNDKLASATVYVYIAASLTYAFDEIIDLYARQQPNVTISINANSSGQLAREIEEENGTVAHIFFSAGKAQVNSLMEKEHLVMEGTTIDMLHNQLCLVTGKNTTTEVTGWDTMDKAKSFALCDGSVPVGQYSRNAFVTLNLLAQREDNRTYTADEISEALGGVEINECANVSAAAQAVAEGSNEIGTIYYSDYYDYQNDLIVLAQDDGTLSGDIVYPMCRINNTRTDDVTKRAVEDFYAFLQTPEAAEIFTNHYFILAK